MQLHTQEAMSFHRSEAFKKLQAEWNAKLKASGFEDIENFDQDGILIHWSSQVSRKRTIKSFNAQQRYFQIACQFAHDYKFESDLDRTVWTLHADGMPMRGIAKKVNLNLRWVHGIIKKLRPIMLKEYSGNE